MELFFDTETTGKHKSFYAPFSDVDNFARLVQLGYIVMDGKETLLENEYIIIPEGFDGMWLMQQLIPGYASLMPFMIAMDGKTVSQLWSEGTPMGNLLPSGAKDFEVVEGELIK